MSRQHLPRLVKPVAKMAPFPVTMLRRCCVNVAPGGAYVLRLQCTGDGSHVGPVPLPTFGLFVAPGDVALPGFFLEGGFKSQVAPGHQCERRQEHGDDARQRGSHDGVTPTPTEALAEGANR